MRSLRTFLLAGATAAALTLGALAPTAAVAATGAPRATATATAAAAPAFRLPLASKTYSVSSYYGPRCIPVQGGSTYHYGVDLAAPAGAPIYAIAPGVVTATVSGTSSRVGYISVRHTIAGVQYTSIYMHIWSATTRVKVGQTVTAGQRISEVGSSGVSSGNHLHLELWQSTANGSVSWNAARFLELKGVNLFGAAKSILAKATPATCTYYTVGGVNFRTGPSTSYSAIKMLPRATAVVHVPGKITSGFIPVKVGTQTGWVSASLVSPTKPAPAPATTPPVVKPTPPVVTPTPPATPTPAAATYATTAPLNLRASASTAGTRLLLVPKGANVGAIQASTGVWRKVTYSGRTGWVHSSYLVKR